MTPLGVQPPPELEGVVAPGGERVSANFDSEDSARALQNYARNHVPREWLWEREEIWASMPDVEGPGKETRAFLERLSVADKREFVG